METPSHTRRHHLAAEIARDILNRNARPTHQSSTCFACGRPYTKGDGRFCHPRCRAGFDLGLPPFEPLDLDKFYSLPKAATGFHINCACCRSRFDSRGWRCCSIECQRDLRRKQELDAELANDPFRVIKRKCLGCGGDIPNWRRGRRISKTTRFCSRRCARKHRENGVRAPNAARPVLGLETAKKCPENGGPRSGLRKGSPPPGTCTTGTTTETTTIAARSEAGGP
jgi:hypothetical protein